jgi:hypothetical protein
MDNVQNCDSCVRLTFNKLAGIKSGIVWIAYAISRFCKRDITRCSPLKDSRRFGGICCLHFQQAIRPSLLPVSRFFLSTFAYSSTLKMEVKCSFKMSAVFNGPRGDLKRSLFKTEAVRISYPMLVTSRKVCGPQGWRRWWTPSVLPSEYYFILLQLPLPYVNKLYILSQSYSNLRVNRIAIRQWDNERTVSWRKRQTRPASKEMWGGANPWGLFHTVHTKHFVGW